MKGRMFAALAVLLVYTAYVFGAGAVAAAQGAPPPGVASAMGAGSGQAQQGAGWVQIIAYVGMLGILAQIARMMLHRDEEELSESRRNLLSALATLVLAVFALTHGIQWLGDVTGANGVLYSTAESFLQQQFIETLDRFTSALLLYEAVQAASSIQFGFEFVVKADIDMGDFLKPVSELADKLLWSIWGFVASMALHKILLVFGHRYAMSTLFPLGLVLWLFPGLRGAGAFLISVSLALWLFFPLTVVAVLMPAASLVQHDPVGIFSGPLGNESAKDYLADTFGASSNSTWRRVIEGLVDTVPPLQSALVAMQSLDDLVRSLANWWAEMFILWYLLPGINIIFLLITIVSLSDVLGGESRTLGRLAKALLPLRR